MKVFPQACKDEKLLWLGWGADCDREEEGWGADCDREEERSALCLGPVGEWRLREGQSEQETDGEKEMGRKRRGERDGEKETGGEKETDEEKETDSLL